MPRKTMTDSEGHEAWRAYELGFTFAAIAKRLNVAPSVLRAKWGSMGYPRGAPKTRPARKWMSMADRLSAELDFTRDEVVWGALKLVDVVALQALVHEAHTSGELVPSHNRSRDRWLRSPYKQRMVDRRRTENRRASGHGQGEQSAASGDSEPAE